MAQHLAIFFARFFSTGDFPKNNLFGFEYKMIDFAASFFFLPSEAPFYLQQPRFPFQTARVTCQRAVGPNHTVARNDDTDGVVSYRIANSLGGHVDGV